MSKEKRKEETAYKKVVELLQKVLADETDPVGIKKAIVQLLLDNSFEITDQFSDINSYESITRKKVSSMKVLKRYGGPFSVRICEDEGKIWIVGKDFSDSYYWHRTPINATNFKDAELYLDLDYALTNRVLHTVEMTP